MADETLRILVVDDDESDRRAARDALLKGSFGAGAIEEARGGREALERVLQAEPPFVCLVMDDDLADIDGMHLLHALPRHASSGSHLPAIPVVLLTGPGGRRLNREMLAAGAQDYVAKDWMTPDSLSRAVENAIARHAMVCELARRESALLDEHRRKDDFLAVLGHELRNPLAAIASGVKLLDSEGLSDNERTWALGMLHQQVGQMGRLLDDLLDLTRIAKGKIELRPQPVNVLECVRRAASAAEDLVAKRQHALSLRVEPATLTVRADPVRLEQIVSNLLMNAAKYTEQRGNIRLDATLEDGQLRLSVMDDGAGIATEDQSKIFQPFTQLYRPGSRGASGLGIGLSIVKKLVEMHGGEIALYSEGLGRGSTFTVTLPEAKAQPQAEEVASRGGRRGTRANGLSVLVVEDNQDLADALAILLRREGCSVEVCYEGLSALDRMQNETPDLLFLDIGLPALSGYDVLAEVTRRGRRPRHVCAVTGFSNAEAREQIAEAGFDTYLVKPISTEHLQTLLQRVGSVRV